MYEDVTSSIDGAAEELQLIGTNSSISSLRFSLLDSMSAVEVGLLSICIALLSNEFVN